MNEDEWTGGEWAETLIHEGPIDWPEWDGVERTFSLFGDCLVRVN